MSTYTLHQGDCLEYMRSMPDKSVDAVITDPPYDFNLHQQADFQCEFERISRGWVIVFAPPENSWLTMALPVQWLFWVKPTSTKNTSRRYSRFVETIMVAGTGVWNSGRHWSQYTNVFNDLVDETFHPHAKPVSLLTRLIKNHTSEGETILDPFMGSGTTIVSALQAGRHSIGCEIDEGYFKIAEKRIKQAALQEPLFT